ncbi:Lipase 1 precursor [Tsukamurella tyrosinosolvens]|uniref:Pimeloyl-ACP methyl ester carboxylesterase n=1 Tax=Tsukamurella tyrosinosolvens TaxID=57704 RepID=A0A1H4LWQ3_TSUTY|nr:alpha/beta fold hydrolase [Tsukamurella tyrosinosolvens]KXO96738.1 alpha/beta hydrolase [Tsukamurella tyrosinosolvens]SEB75113.1 Pimeloyl-ACP methyl ester carboxylesterase [Tsukamurella tyrosinosolvens]VEH88521.1 Lipase 1 precursor [Tsukamurella tyrosinosolvens]
MTRSIPVRGRWVRVRESGDASLPTLLLLHGITRSLEDWDPTFEALEGEYHLIAPDLAGYGWSAPHPDGAGLAALADGVAETLAALNVAGPVHVAGNSLGGAVTMTLLARHPELVASMTLVDPAGFGKEVTPLLRLLGVPVLGKLIATTPSRPGAIVQERLIFADKSYATRARIDHAMAIARETDAGLTAWKTADALGSVLGGVRQDWRDELHRTIARTPRPTMVLWGSRDKVLPPAHLDNARALIPHAETHLIPGVGHMPQLECTREFAALITSFLQRNPVAELPKAASQ